MLGDEKKEAKEREQTVNFLANTCKYEKLESTSSL